MMIKRVFIWSGWLRGLHGLMIVALLVLALTGWLLTQAQLHNAVFLQWHQIANSVLAVSLLIRIILLLVGKGAEHIKSFFNQGLPLKQVKDLLAFYLTLGKRPLPSWFSRSVLWAFLYLLMYLLMLFSIISGLLMPQRDMLLGWVLYDLHQQIAIFLLWIIALHIVTAIFHDVKGENSNVSAMLNGHRIFIIEQQKSQEQVVNFPQWSGK